MIQPSFLWWLGFENNRLFLSLPPFVSLLLHPNLFFFYLYIHLSYHVSPPSPVYGDSDSASALLSVFVSDFSSEVQPLMALEWPQHIPQPASLCSTRESLLHKSENPPSFVWIEQEKLEAFKGFEDLLCNGQLTLVGAGKVVALHLDQVKLTS